MAYNIFFKAYNKFKREILQDKIYRLINKKYKIRNDDFIIASFPKSGRTWLRFFFASYILY